MIDYLIYLRVLYWSIVFFDGKWVIKKIHMVVFITKLSGHIVPKGVVSTLTRLTSLEKVYLVIKSLAIVLRVNKGFLY